MQKVAQKKKFCSVEIFSFPASPCTTILPLRMNNGSVTVNIFSLQLVTKILLHWFHGLLVTNQLSMLRAGLQRF